MSEGTYVLSPPMTLALDASAQIEPVPGGFAVITPLVRVELSDLLLDRLATNRAARP